MLHREPHFCYKTHMYRRGVVWLSAVAALFFLFPAISHAQTKSDVDDLSTQIRARQDRVKELDGMIGTYRSKINAAQDEAASLENQLALLENRIAEKELAVERAKTEIESLNLEIRLIDAEISSQEARIETQRQLLASLIREVHHADETSALEVLLTEPSLSKFFAQVEEIKRLEGDLGRMLERVKGVKAQLEEKRRDQKAKQVRAEEERRSMRKEQLSLEAERNFKASLVSQTKLKEQEFERIVYELRQQQQDTSDDISALEDRLKERLDDVDEALARGDVLLNWPVDPSRGITAIFHDPTYPFRHLFEHPGTDVRSSVGTAVKSAAGGYVAWNKTGRMYGNYTMVVHPGGIATVYAHLSKFLADPDTFVDRLETIGLSGGRPGDPGAGLSTGPHLHFEVRQDGIPVDAENYLPTIPEGYYDYYDDYKKLKVRP
jgi:murein DD-endopeptidase MepM/ murein hydrolase activator NlpD